MKNNLKRTSKQDQEMESYKLTLKYFLKKFIFNNIIKYLAHEFEKKYYSIRLNLGTRTLFTDSELTSNIVFITVTVVKLNPCC